MNDNVVYHYTKTDSAFSIIEPEHQNKSKYLMDNIIGIIKKAGIKPYINTNDLIKNMILSQIQKIYNTKFFFCFRASLVENTNDPSEKDLAYSYIQETLCEIEDNEFKDIIDKFENHDDYKSIFNILKQNSYVISYSAKKNDLNQWRLYADNGKGISLGIEKRALEDIKNSAYGISFLPIVYNRNKFKQYLKTIIDNMPNKSIINNIQTEHDKIAIEELIKIFSINNLSSSIKHECYKSEEEYRIIANPLFLNYLINNKNRDKSYIKFFLNFRDTEKYFLFTPEKIIAYKEIPLPMEALKEVWLGPKNQSKINIVEDYLAKLGYENVKVYKSKLPYK